METARAYMQNNVQQTGDINTVMEHLYESAVHWADTTMFTTKDVSAAIAEAAQAGWDYEKMLNGIPAAMLLAQAGGINLSQALDYVITASNATRTPFANVETFIDRWAVAASNGSATIAEMGEAMLKVGGTSQFA